MPNPTRRHIGRVNKLNRVFTSKLGESVIVSIQNGMFVNEMSEPRPDVVICKPLPELFGPFEPATEDVLLLVEISDTSIHTTRVSKRPYTRKAIKLAVHKTGLTNTKNNTKVKCVLSGIRSQVPQRVAILSRLIPAAV